MIRPRRRFPCRRSSRAPLGPRQSRHQVAQPHLVADRAGRAGPQRRRPSPARHRAHRCGCRCRERHRPRRDVHPPRLTTATRACRHCPMRRCRRCQTRQRMEKMTNHRRNRANRQRPHRLRQSRLSPDPPPPQARPGAAASAGQPRQPPRRSGAAGAMDHYAVVLAGSYGRRTAPRATIGHLPGIGRCTRAECRRRHVIGQMDRPAAEVDPPCPSGERWPQNRTDVSDAPAHPRFVCPRTTGRSSAPSYPRPRPYPGGERQQRCVLTSRGAGKRLRAGDRAYGFAGINRSGAAVPVLQHLQLRPWDLRHVVIVPGESSILPH